MKKTWVILGATSAIANEFARIAAENKHDLILVGRNLNQLEVIANDLRLRFKINCEIIACDFAEDIKQLLEQLQTRRQDLALFVAYCHMVNNNELTPAAIESMVYVNVLSIVQLIHAYLTKKQSSHQLIFLSSVAACRGRAKNSLYGGTKAAIDTYLQGLQQNSGKNCKITIARLGYIDTTQTYGKPGIFYAAAPYQCAKACWKANHTNKLVFYYPFFWRYIMSLIKIIPTRLFCRIKGL